MVLGQIIMKMYMRNMSDSTGCTYNKCIQLFVVLKKVHVGGMAQSITNISKEQQNWKMCAGAQWGHVVEIVTAYPFSYGYFLLVLCVPKQEKSNCMSVCH